MVNPNMPPASSFDEKYTESLEQLEKTIQDSVLAPFKNIEGAHVDSAKSGAWEVSQVFEDTDGRGDVRLLLEFQGPASPLTLDRSFDAAVIEERVKGDHGNLYTDSVPEHRGVTQIVIRTVRLKDGASVLAVFPVTTLDVAASTPETVVTNGVASRNGHTGKIKFKKFGSVPQVDTKPKDNSAWTFPPEWKTVTQGSEDYGIILAGFVQKMLDEGWVDPLSKQDVEATLKRVAPYTEGIDIDDEDLV